VAALPVSGDETLLFPEASNPPMGTDLIRREQVRKMLLLVHEAREIGGGPRQRRHLVDGIQRIIGGVKTDCLVDADFGPGRRARVEDLVSSFNEDCDQNIARICQEMSRGGCRRNPAFRALTFRVRAPQTALRRRELLADGDWYSSEFFNDHLRACRFDDQLYSVRSLGRTRVEALGLTRGLHDRPFADEDRNLLELFHEEVARLDRLQQPPGDHPRLTPRESEVLRCLLTGAAEKAVASDLGISPQTVHGHVKSIYAAYGVSSRAELLARCLTGAAQRV